MTDPMPPMQIDYDGPIGVWYRPGDSSLWSFDPRAEQPLVMSSWQQRLALATFEQVLDRIHGAQIRDKP